VHSSLGLRGDGVDRLVVYVAGDEEEGEKKKKEEAVVPPTDMMIGEIGEKWVDEDGFLYLGYYIVLGGGLLERTLRGLRGGLGY